MRAMESVLESHGPHESLELSIVRIGLETAELRVDNEMQNRYCGWRQVKAADTAANQARGDLLRLEAHSS